MFLFSMQEDSGFLLFFCQHLIVCLYIWCMVCIHARCGLSKEVRGKPWVWGLIFHLFNAEIRSLPPAFCCVHEASWSMSFLLSLLCISVMCWDSQYILTTFSGFYMTSEDSNSNPHACVVDLPTEPFLSQRLAVFWEFSSQSSCMLSCISL